MVLAGFVISVGVVVDDAIIDIENIVRRLRQNRAAESPGRVMSVVLEASLEVRRAIVYATLIIVLAVMPVFFITSVSGAFFRPLVHVVRPGRAGVDGGRAHGHARAGAAPARRGRRSTRSSRRSCACSSGAYTAALARVVRTPILVVGATAAHAGGGRGGDAVPRRVALPDVQGARLPRALGDAAGHGPPGGRADRRAGEPRPALDPGRARLRGAHRPGGAGRGGQRHQLRRGLAQPEPRRRLRQDARSRSRTPSPPTRASSASRRPT